MTLNLHDLQLVSLVAIGILLFAGRLTKGSSLLTPQGLAFPLKPMVVWSRGLALCFYVGLFAYPLWISQRSIPPWLLLLLFVAVVFSVYQLPGTILLTPTAVIQRFWMRSEKTIPYGDVMAIQANLGGRQTRVMGANRVSITHTFNHAAAAEFQTELERRTNRPVRP